MAAASPYGSFLERVNNLSSVVEEMHNAQTLPFALEAIEDAFKRLQTALQQEPLQLRAEGTVKLAELRQRINVYTTPAVAGGAPGPVVDLAVRAPQEVRQALDDQRVLAVRAAIITSDIDTGWGHALFMRGDPGFIPEMSWDKGLPMTWTDGRWRVLINADRTFNYKFVIGSQGATVDSKDSTWELHDNRTFTPPILEPALEPREALQERETACELFASGARTRMGGLFVCHLSLYTISDSLLHTPDGTSYALVSGNTQKFSSTHLASCGSTISREVLLMRPDSVVLERHYKQLRNSLHLGMTTEQVLEAIKTYMQARVFHVKGDRLEEEVQEMVEAARRTHITTTHKTIPHALPIPLMLVDDFVTAGIGVCRHHSLVAAYFLDRLLSETKPLIRGTVQHIRCNVAGIGGRGGHVWVTFIPKRTAAEDSPEKWHLDTLWDFLENYALEQGRRNLALVYGTAMLKDQIDRTNNAAKYNGQPEG